MADKRMFSKMIIDSDAFLDMSLSSQALYFHLAMRADDEGFINNPKRIQKLISASEDDMKILIAKKFVLAFESGVIVIKHWMMHNYIRKERLKLTPNLEERSRLYVRSNGSYSLNSHNAILLSDKCQPHVSQMSDKRQSNVRHVSDKCQSNVRIDKIRLDKIRLDKDRIDVVTKNENNNTYYDDILKYWNTHSKLSSIKKMTEERKQYIDDRIAENDIKTIYDVIDAVRDSDFLAGENKDNWIASFDWVFKSQENFIKVLEGNYMNVSTQFDLKKIKRMVG